MRTNLFAFFCSLYCCCKLGLKSVPVFSLLILLLDWNISIWHFLFGNWICVMQRKWIGPQSPTPYFSFSAPWWHSVWSPGKAGSQFRKCRFYLFVLDCKWLEGVLRSALPAPRSVPSESSQPWLRLLFFWENGGKGWGNTNEYLTKFSLPFSLHLNSQFGPWSEC